MGADLYIRSLFNKCKEEHEEYFRTACFVRDALPRGTKVADQAQELVSYFSDKMYESGYFRDSYNSSSLFRQLDLSWWQDLPGYTENDPDGIPRLMPDGARKLLLEVQSRKIPDLQTFKAKNAEWLGRNEDSPEKWHQYFVEKQERFIKFLETAIELDEPIECLC